MEATTVLESMMQCPISDPGRGDVPRSMSALEQAQWRQITAQLRQNRRSDMTDHSAVTGDQKHAP
eukprot:1139648-Pelagomonas_calceolata.AAC.3